jgi:hypothetical protein
MDLSSLDQHFLAYPYACGFQPSTADQVLMHSLSAKGDQLRQYPHLWRWVKHIETVEKSCPHLPTKCNKRYMFFHPVCDCLILVASPSTVK